MDKIPARTTTMPEPTGAGRPIKSAQSLTDHFMCEKGMLFVRNYSNCKLMLSARAAFVRLGTVFTLLLFGVVVVVVVVAGTSTHAEAQSPPQSQLHPPVSYPAVSSFLAPTVSDLELVLYSDGLVHVSYALALDPLAPYVTVDLYGSAVDNFVAVGENGFILSEDISNTTAVIHTFGTATAMIDYDIHDLVSKSGRMWKFAIDAPVDFSLHMPSDAVLVGLDVIPDNLTIQEDYALTLNLGSGSTDLIYIIAGVPVHPHATPLDASDESTLRAEESSLPAQAAPAPDDLQKDTDTTTTATVVAATAAVSALAIVLFFKNRAKNPASASHEERQPVGHTTDDRKVPMNATRDTSEDSEPEKEHFTSLSPLPSPHALEEMLSLHVDLRDDDKDIVRFIFESGGVVLESDLRKKFIEPKTTMWRAVKRLERSGIVTTTKKDMQNQVRLVLHAKEKDHTSKNTTQDQKGDEAAR